MLLIAVESHHARPSILLEFPKPYTAPPITAPRVLATPVVAFPMPCTFPRGAVELFNSKSMASKPKVRATTCIVKSTTTAGQNRKLSENQRPLSSGISM